MNLLEKGDADNRLPANQSRPLFKQVKQTATLRSSRSKPLRTSAGTLTFVEDFTLEHSLTGTQIASIEILGSFRP
jgi:hypothetical protein